MKKVWSKPELDVLDIRMTMAGPGIAIVDADHADDHDPDEDLHHS